VNTHLLIFFLHLFLDQAHGTLYKLDQALLHLTTVGSLNKKSLTHPTKHATGMQDWMKLMSEISVA
jgi:hypothetical protein